MQRKAEREGTRASIVPVFDVAWGDSCSGAALTMKRRGHKHSPGEKQLMAQVSDVFTKKIEELGAKRAAKELGVSLASFYNYAAGSDLPRMEILQRAQEKKWTTKWKYLDPSNILSTRNIPPAEQLLLPLSTVRARDIEVVSIKPKKSNVLQVTLSIRFSA